jgi:hypothetical protein
MSTTHNSNLERFYAGIGYDSEKMTANIRGTNVFVQIDNDAESSYLDTEYYATTGEWLVHVVNPTRPLKELLFDFYHEVGRIFLKKGFIDTTKPSIWLDKVQCGVSSRQYIMSEMACDGYAISELKYSGNIPKLIPNVKKSTIIMQHQDASAEDIDRYLYEINNDLSVRREYLRWLISENTVFSGVDTRTMPLKDVINFDTLPIKNSKNKISRYAAYNILDELAESVGIKTATVANLQKAKTLMMENLDKIGISYSPAMEFNQLCDRLIKAITSENINTNYFTINNKNGEIDVVRIAYKTIVEDFIIPWTAKFKDQYRVTDRNETRYVIERVLNYYITTKQYPSQEHITELQNDFRNINIDKTKMNSRVVGLLSYNEKVQIAKKNHKKKNNETDEMYESRIKDLVYANRYNEKA